MHLNFEFDPAASESGTVNREVWRSEITFIQPTEHGPKITRVGTGKSSQESQAIPEEQLSLSERLAIEALPLLPNGIVCAPLTQEELKSLGDGPISICKSKEASAMTDWEKNVYKQETRFKLSHGDKVVREPSGFLIIRPLPEIMG